jgi:hypothetical protein
MKDLLKRFTSRKFLLVIGGILMHLSGVLAPAEAEAITGLIVAFLGAEGLADVVGRYTAGRFVAPVVQQNRHFDKMLFDEDEDEPDKSRIVPGE